MHVDQLVPLNDRILIEVIPDETQKYEGMIAVQETAQEKSNIAVVKAVPPMYNSYVQVGDKVVFNRHAGSVFKTDHFDKSAPEFRLIKESDLLCKIND